MHVYTYTANESRIFKYPHIVDEAGIEYYPVILEGDAHFCYYQDDEYLREKYAFGYWACSNAWLGSKSSLVLTPKSIFGIGGMSRHITIVYKIPINERPVKFYYQICDSDGMLLRIASKDL